MSNLVHTAHFCWNNLHQVGSKLKDWNESKIIFKSLWMRENQIE